MPPTDWPTIRLGDVARFRKGVSYQGAFLDRPGPLLLGLGTIVQGGGIKFNEARSYGGPIKPWQFINPGEVLVALTDITQDGRILGAPGYLPTPSHGTYAVTHHVARVEIMDSAAIDSRFLYYLLQAPPAHHYMRGVATGTTVRAVSPRDAEAFTAAVPSVAEQHEIARILGALDDKIELNRRMSETLEAMARALFKSWFVDFDPVRAKAKGRDPGVPPPIAALFPHHLNDSELGRIPAGWPTTTLADFARLNPESWSGANRPETLRYVDLSSTKWGRIDAIVTHPAASAPSRAQRVIRPGDTIVGAVRPGNGSYALVTEEGLTGSTGFAVLRPTRAGFAEFVYLAATDRENIEALAHLADGAAYPAVRPEVVLATPVVRAPGEVLEAFSDVARPMMYRMATGHAESRTLAAIRDTLLPKLTSGEIRVPQAGRMLEAAPA